MKLMKRSWFKEWGLIYIPISWQGTFLSTIIALFLTQVFLAVEKNSHSISDTLYGIFPYWAPIILIWLWVASKTSKKDK